MIEKAYKKLRLDALVIQQGRLTDNVKGVNKDDLLQMVRYGAEKVFSGGTVRPPPPPPPARACMLLPPAASAWLPLAASLNRHQLFISIIVAASSHWAV